MITCLAVSVITAVCALPCVFAICSVMDNLEGLNEDSPKAKTLLCFQNGIYDGPRYGITEPHSVSAKVEPIPRELYKLPGTFDDRALTAVFRAR